MGFCPEGATGLSLGFQPQEPIKENPRPKGAVEAVPLSLYDCPNSCRPRNTFRPYRAGPIWDAFLGLKPQAESCRPFGAEEPRPTWP
jgi:hypothetical protein